jgi:hypothetical protein
MHDKKNSTDIILGSAIIATIYTLEKSMAKVVASLSRYYKHDIKSNLEFLVRCAVYQTQIW